MLVRIGRPSYCFALILGLSAGWGSNCAAAGMYTVTDLTELPSSQAAEAMALHPWLGLTLTDAEKAALPSVGVWQGVADPRLLSIQLDPMQNTDSGIVLGIVPSGGSRATPYEMLEEGYARKNADGTFGPYTHLVYMKPDDPMANNPGGSGPFGFASLDAKGVALVTDYSGQRLIDLNTGIATDLQTLLPPGALDHVGNINTPSMILRANIAADGTIFATVGSPGGYYADGLSEHTLMLTPLSTPEPSTLVAFAAIALGLAGSRRRSKS